MNTSVPPDCHPPNHDGTTTLMGACLVQHTAPVGGKPEGEQTLLLEDSTRQLKSHQVLLQAGAVQPHGNDVSQRSLIKSGKVNALRKKDAHMDLPVRRIFFFTCIPLRTVVSAFSDGQAMSTTTRNALMWGDAWEHASTVRGRRHKERECIHQQDKDTQARREPVLQPTR